VTYPPAVTRFLIERAIAAGAVVKQGRAVRRINQDGVLLANDELVSATVTINATGSWSPELTPGIDVQKRKGHLVITDRYPGFVRHQLVELGYLKSAHSLTEDSVAFNAQPRRTGQVLIGSSRQYGSQNSSIDQPMLSRMLSRAVEYIARHRQAFRHSILDRLSCRDNRQIATDRTIRGQSETISRDWTRGSWHHYVSRNSETCRRSVSQPDFCHSDRAIPSDEGLESGRSLRIHA
jgi:glycine/D-amino acid oxidase-like deaminating enzyme